MLLQVPFNRAQWIKFIQIPVPECLRTKWAVEGYSTTNYARDKMRPGNTILSSINILSSIRGRGKLLNSSASEGQDRIEHLARKSRKITCWLYKLISKTHTAPHSDVLKNQITVLPASNHGQVIDKYHLK